MFSVIEVFLIESVICGDTLRVRNFNRLVAKQNCVKHVCITYKMYVAKQIVLLHNLVAKQNTSPPPLEQNFILKQLNYHLKLIISYYNCN